MYESVRCERRKRGGNNIMKKKTLLALLLVAAMTFMAACGGEDTGNTDNQEGESGALSGSVSLNGSTSVESVIGALTEAFMAENPDVSITYDPTGSGAGITAVTNGTTDIGLASRSLNEDETGLTETAFALDGIAIIVNPENPVADLTMEQIKGLADGTITNWSEVGGNDAEVVLVGREAGSGTRDGFESIVGVEDVCVYQQELTSTGSVIAAVAANPQAIGYASLASVNEDVKAVTVDGIEASEATVLDGTYTLQRPFNFIMKEGEALSAPAQAFVDFALSAEAKDIIAQAGAVQPE